jgi:hypothetical protein
VSKARAIVMIINAANVASVDFDAIAKNFANMLDGTRTASHNSPPV